MCGLGVPVGCRMKHAEGMFERWHLRAGKRQAWTPIKRFKGFKVIKGFKGFKGFKRFKGFKGLRAGKRQAWTPIRKH